MAETPEVPPGGPVPAAALLRPGERLGWIFRDPFANRRPYPHPAPARGRVPEEVLAAAKAANAHLIRNLAIGIPAAVLVGFLLSCGVSYVAGDHGLPLFFILIFLTLVATIAGILWWAWRAWTIQDRPGEMDAEFEARYGTEMAAYNGGKGEFDAAELRRAELLPEWLPALTPPTVRRLDIVGGSLWGWEGLLTVFGLSTLAGGSQLMVLDLTGEALCRELADLASDSGISTDVQVLPEELATADLLSGLDPRQFADVLVEAVHGRDTETTGDRFSQSMDGRILGAISAALAPSLTVFRVLAALRALLGEGAPAADPTAGPVPAGLTEDERRTITEELFPPDYRQEIGPRLRQLESLLHPLAGLGVAAESRPAAQLVCVATTNAGSSAREEMLGDLIVQRLTRAVAGSGGGQRTVVVVGADPIARRHLERLSDLCERRSIRLVYLFRHLRETSLQVLGAGAVGFMRLGNHQEATQAADFIGREQKFLLTRLTHQLGGAETHTQANTESETVTRERRMARFSLLKPWRMLGGLGGSTARSWSTTASHAQGTNWNAGESYQRAVEYSVEPRILQGLPDYAMLLVTAGERGPTISAIECNPAIVTLPKVAADPVSAEDLAGPLPPGVSAGGHTPLGGQREAAPPPGQIEAAPAQYPGLTPPGYAQPVPLPGQHPGASAPGQTPPPGQRPGPPPPPSSPPWPPRH